MINILANEYTIDADWCFKRFQKYIKKDHRVVIVPFSFRDDQIYSHDTWQDYYSKNEGKYYHSIMQAFKRYGIKESNVKWLNYFDDSIEYAKELISNADVLYFTGGLPDKMMARLHKFKLLNTIENHPGVLIGFSAGALIQFEVYHLTPENDYETFRYCNGMKIIRDFNIEVHYNQSEHQKHSISRVVKETRKPLYAIEDEGALIIDKDQIITVGKVHYFEV
jgi:peptidase E